MFCWLKLRNLLNIGSCHLHAKASQTLALFDPRSTLSSSASPFLNRLQHPCCKLQNASFDMHHLVSEIKSRIHSVSLIIQLFTSDSPHLTQLRSFFMPIHNSHHLSNPRSFTPGLKPLICNKAASQYVRRCSLLLSTE